MSYPELLERIEARLREIKERCDAATPGPWGMYDGWGADSQGNHRCRRIGQMGNSGRTVLSTGYDLPIEDLVATRDDFEFIAHARNDLPALVGWAQEMVETWVRPSLGILDDPTDWDARQPRNILDSLALALGIKE